MIQKNFIRFPAHLYKVHLTPSLKPQNNIYIIIISPSFFKDNENFYLFLAITSSEGPHRTLPPENKSVNFHTASIGLRAKRIKS